MESLRLERRRGHQVIVIGIDPFRRRRLLIADREQLGVIDMEVAGQISARHHVEAGGAQRFTALGGDQPQIPGAGTFEDGGHIVQCEPEGGPLVVDGGESP